MATAVMTEHRVDPKQGHKGLMDLLNAAGYLMDSATM
jgi:hypothetical protein